MRRCAPAVVMEVVISRACRVQARWWRRSRNEAIRLGLMRRLLGVVGMAGMEDSTEVGGREAVETSTGAVAIGDD